MNFRIKALLCLINIVVLFSACQNIDNRSKKRESEYLDYKSKFDNKFIDQFPPKTQGRYVEISSKTNTDKNDVGLYLYEKDVDPTYLNQVLSTWGSRAVKSYRPLDSCLLVVNKFDTVASFERVLIEDSSFIERTCYASAFPIPNFKSDDSFSTYPNLDSSFVIYVLECHTKNPYGSKYPLASDPQMPKAWVNGYSKGIAVSKQQRTVVYWSIMW